MEPAAVLVVEDEHAIRAGLCDVLTYHGLIPTGIEGGIAGLNEALTGRYALVILDVMLPGLDGLSICERVRAKLPRQAILMLTAKGGEQDVLEGFRRGADDYVPKPFSVAQLMARVEALLRRAQPPAARPDEAFAAGPLMVDPGALRAVHGGRACDLTRRDVELLACFARAGGAVVPRRQLLEEVWGFGRAGDIESRCIDMHLVKLRRKLGEAFGAAAERLIETVRGEGYRLAVASGRASS